jgi:hypothetical protein
MPQEIISYEYQVDQAYYVTLYYNVEEQQHQRELFENKSQPAPHFITIPPINNFHQLSLQLGEGNILFLRFDSL